METGILACAGILLLLLIAAGIYFLSRRPFRYSRRKEGQNTCLSFNARQNLERITVRAQFDGEEISFERKRVRKGQTVDFVFPYSESRVKISVTDESGHTKEFEA
ncbi:MAG TPA: hypothetical protein VLD37_06015 [Candidatus Bilamarchaeum sp.]|nr:hypothetical protein [Candidatus Bilamarchaeum sp.]